MKLLVTADTDAGLRKKMNQDSILVKHVQVGQEEVMLAVVCDGMGGLAKGELASATVIRTFSEWFEKEFPYEMDSLDWKRIGLKWESMIGQLNRRILEYGKKHGINLGTTFSGLLMIGDDYLIGHVGDTRIYHLGHMICQLTEDQTVIAKEIREKRLTPQQALTDKRKNVLLQCIGASKEVIPQILYGKVEKGIYLLCSDGFRNKISEEEIMERFGSDKMTDKNVMHKNALEMIELVKERNEQDNISVVLIKAE